MNVLISEISFGMMSDVDETERRLGRGRSIEAVSVVDFFHPQSRTSKFSRGSGSRENLGVGCVAGAGYFTVLLWRTHSVT